ncbi:MAG: redox-sensing transcriptional repressor Rex [Firmicutes bacterium]|nr:redox-sensing transcriptional repressor Rex [Bacillota bacterium]
MTDEISPAVVRRLPRYYRYLGELRRNGVARISSMELSERMKLTASQIRQDLNNFGCFGQQGYGYNVGSLLDEIGRILGLTRSYAMVAVGAGHLGQALARDERLAQRGFVFRALFDIDPALIGARVNGAQILAADKMEDFLRENPVDIAALTLPTRESAEQALGRIAACGVKALWNFTHVDLDLSAYPNVIVENVHLTDSLMMLSYKLAKEKQE